MPVPVPMFDRDIGADSDVIVDTVTDSVTVTRHPSPSPVSRHPSPSPVAVAVTRHPSPPAVSHQPSAATDQVTVAATDSVTAHRDTCERCRRPTLVCYCAHIPSLPTRTKVVLLQHPRERRKAIGTARMAHLSLPGSELHSGVSFANDPLVGGAIGRGTSTAQTYVLFPGPTAVDPRSLPRGGPPITLVVLDGTWSQAKKLLSSNPELRALPRIGISPQRPSEYRIRKQPAEFCVSTIEALAEVLGALEGEPYDRLLDPFRAMVDRQLWYRREVNASRHLHLHAAPRTARNPSLPRRLRDNWSRLVCVFGESNGWPRWAPERRDPEIVHWLAHRPSTGETYHAIIAPRSPLAPATPYHIKLDEQTLQAGISRVEWQKTWTDYLRPDDILVPWGNFYMTVAERAELILPPDRIDLRGLVPQLREKKLRGTSPGTIERCYAEVAATLASLDLPGRGGERLAMLVGVVEAISRLTELPRSALTAAEGSS